MQHMKSCGLLVFGMWLSLFVVYSAFADDASEPQITTENVAKCTISIGTEILDGDTTYKIGYPVTMDGVTSQGYFPFSELKWPLDVVMARMDGTATFSGGWRIRGYLKKNLNDPDGNMEDSDWLTDSNPSQLDVFSESSISDFSAFVADFDIEYIFAEKPNFSFYGGFGFQYQNFDFSSNLIQQYSPSGQSGFDYTGDGGVSILYEMTYYIPYLLLGADIQVGERFALNTSIAYSPYVTARDQDNHLLRENGGKVTSGDMDGTGIIFRLSGKYNFTPTWYTELGFNYVKIDVEGTMEQSYVWYGHFASNKVESESTQTSGYINIGANF